MSWLFLTLWFSFPRFLHKLTNWSLWQFSLFFSPKNLNLSFMCGMFPCMCTPSVYVYHVHMYAVHVYAGACRGQEAADPLELELEHLWVAQEWMLWVRPCPPQEQQVPCPLSHGSSPDGVVCLIKESKAFLCLLPDFCFFCSFCTQYPFNACQYFTWNCEEIT